MPIRNQVKGGVVETFTVVGAVFGAFALPATAIAAAVSTGNGGVTIITEGGIDALGAAGAVAGGVSGNVVGQAVGTFMQALADTDAAKLHAKKRGREREYKLGDCFKGAVGYSPEFKKDVARYIFGCPRKPEIPTATPIYDGAYYGNASPE